MPNWEPQLQKLEGSSTDDAKSRVDDRTESGRSFIKMRNNNGSRTVPWGMLLASCTLSEVVLSIITCCDLSVRKALIHLKVFACMQ